MLMRSKVYCRHHLRSVQVNMFMAAVIVWLTMGVFALPCKQDRL